MCECVCGGVAGVDIYVGNCFYGLLLLYLLMYYKFCLLFIYLFIAISCLYSEVNLRLIRE